MAPTETLGKLITLPFKPSLLKELIIKPNKGMSFQRHKERNEIWLVSKGMCRVNFSKNKPDEAKEICLDTHDYFIVERTNWHQIINPYDVPCHIIEIQYGTKTVEDDIERLYYYKES